MQTQPSARQIEDMFRATDRSRMLAGKEQPRQEAFLFRNGDVDWESYDRAWSRYNATLKAIFHH